MKRLLIALFSSLVVMSLLLTGCGGDKTEEPIKLTFASWMPPPDVAHYTGTFETWARDFEEKTGGRYTVEVVHGGALAGVPESYDAVATGIADIAMFIPQDTDHPFPMSNVVALPFRQVRCDTATKALHEVWKEGYFDAEYADVKILFLNTTASSDDLISTKPVSSLADLKGMKVGTGGGARITLAERLGMAPVFSPPPEVYGMLQKGTIEGTLISGYGLYPDNHADFLRYIVEPVRMFRCVHIIAMNLDTYNSMPEDVQKIVDEMDKDAKYSLMGATVLADEYEATIERFVNEVGAIVTLNAGDTAVVESICTDIFDDWIAEMDAQGLPGSEIVAAYYNALKAEGMENPAMGYQP